MAILHHSKNKNKLQLCEGASACIVRANNIRTVSFIIMLF